MQKSHIYLFLIVLIFNSCATPENEISITTEKQLKDYIFSKNNKLVFKDINAINMNKTEIPEPIYLSSMKELNEFL